MLRELHVQNYALMVDLSIEFGDGLNLLTGETGVGKSILIGALGFLLGEKGDVDLIRTGAERVTVEGSFEISKDLESTLGRLAPLEADVEEGTPDSGITLILKRNLSQNGRSQCYLNGSATPLSLLRKIGDHLLDIHGQHEHQSLLKVENHLRYLDSFARLGEERDRVGKLYRDYETLLKEISEKETKRKELTEREELWRFQWEEIDRAGVEEGEDLKLERQRVILENAQELLKSSQEISERLSTGEGCVGEHLGIIQKLFEGMADLDPRLKESLENANTLSYQVDDLWRSLLDYEKRIEFDPNRLDQANERLDLLNTLKKKYGGSLKAALEYKERVDTELQNFERNVDETKSLHERLKKVKEELSVKIFSLSQKREKGAENLENQIKKELKDLGMEGSRFQVGIKQKEDPRGLVEMDGKRFQAEEDGMDRIEFLLSTNPGEELKPLRKIASGGEISRIMLALKGLLKDQIPTLIFDEVDAGIGGRMAEVIGSRLQNLSKKKQIICITHLPQIAAQGGTHYRVIKKIEKGRTLTQIIPLKGEERKREIARMLGGPNQIALQHAGEMLNKAENS